MRGPGVDFDRLLQVLSDVGLAEPMAVEEMTGGSSRMFRIDLRDGSSVVLRTHDDIWDKMPVRESFAAALQVDTGIPVTRYLAIDETRSRLPFRFSLTTYLPGRTVGSLREEPEIGKAYGQMGALLRRLQSIRLPAYGRFDSDGVVEPVATNAAFVARDAAHAFEQFRRQGGDSSLAVEPEQRVAARLQRAVFSEGPVFAHDDFHPNNLLAVRDGAGGLLLSGPIDFGNAHAADAVWDLAKTLFMMEHDAPESGAAILEGYGPVDHPDLEAALFVYTLIHRVTMWWWLRKIGVIGNEATEQGLIVDLRQMLMPTS